jgi:hypothetical protein
MSASRAPNVAEPGATAPAELLPKWTSGDGQISQNAWLKDPNIKEAIAAVYSFPHADDGHRRHTDEVAQQFQSAMKKYAPKVLTSDSKQPATTV